MPYIKSERRGPLTLGYPPQDAGELNYLLTVTVLKYIQERGASYQTFNDCMGALTGCQMELYRRQISMYEDQKREENGDVY